MLPGRPACGNGRSAIDTLPTPLRRPSDGRRTSTVGGPALLRAVGLQSLRRRAHRPRGPWRRRPGGLQQSDLRGRILDARRLLRRLAAASPLLHQVQWLRPCRILRLITGQSYIADVVPGCAAGDERLLAFIVEQNLVEISLVMLVVLYRETHYMLA